MHMQNRCTTLHLKDDFINLHSCFFLQHTIFEGAYFLWAGYTRPQLLRLDNIIHGVYSHSSAVYDMCQEPQVERIEFTIDEVVYLFLSRSVFEIDVFHHDLIFYVCRSG